MSETIWPLFDVCLSVESNTCPNMKRRHETEPFWIIKSSRFCSRRQFWSTLDMFCWFDHVAGSFIVCWKGKTNPPTKRSGKQFVLLSETAIQICYGARATKQLKHMVSWLWEVFGKILQMVVFNSFEITWFLIPLKVNMKLNLIMFLGFLCVHSATLFRT